MLFRRGQMKMRDFANCHEGVGVVKCTELFAGPAGDSFRFGHDDVLAPGVTIGEHRHENDAEIYMVLEGRGRLILDGESHDVGPGDIAITGPGHSHGISNTGDTPLRLLVIGSAPVK